MAAIAVTADVSKHLKRDRKLDRLFQD